MSKLFSFETILSSRSSLESHVFGGVYARTHLYHRHPQRGRGRCFYSELWIIALRSSWLHCVDSDGIMQTTRTTILPQKRKPSELHEHVGTLLFVLLLLYHEHNADVISELQGRALTRNFALYA